MSQFALYIMTLKGYKSLNALVNNGHKHLISYVVYGEDKNIQSDYSKDIIALCRANDINYFDKKNIDTKLNYNYVIAISWRWLIKDKLNTPIIVLHDSLLPKYRGFAPLISCLINRETKIGVTAIIASKEYDRGPIISQETITITYPIKIEHAIEKITKCYVNLVLNIFNTVKIGNELTFTAQNEEEATYSLWRDHEDYYINWNWSSEKIKRFVDAVGYPYSGALTKMDNKLVTVLDVTVVNDVVIEDRMVGKLIFYIDEYPVFVCNKGLIKINKAIYNDTSESIFPLKKFRTRLT